MSASSDTWRALGHRSLEWVSYLLGVLFGLAAGFVLAVDTIAAVVNLGLAITFVAAGLATRSRHHDDDRRRAGRWAAVALSPVWVLGTIGSVAFLIDHGVDRDIVALLVVSLASLGFAIRLWFPAPIPSKGDVYEPPFPT